MVAHSLGGLVCEQVNRLPGLQTNIGANSDNVQVAPHCSRLYGTACAHPD